MPLERYISNWLDLKTAILYYWNDTEVPAPEIINGQFGNMKQREAHLTILQEPIVYTSSALNPNDYRECRREFRIDAYAMDEDDMYVYLEQIIEIILNPDKIIGDGKGFWNAQEADPFVLNEKKTDFSIMVTEERAVF